MLRKLFRIDELLCCLDVKVLVCKAMKMFKSWWPKNDERTTNDERTDWSEFRTIGPNSERLVRIPNDWSEFRTIGPNPDRLVRIPNDWSESRTIGPNSERMTNDKWQIWCCERRERVWRSEIFQSVKCPKKIGVDWPRPSRFRKIFQRVKVQIEKSAWTGLGKVKRKASSAASVFNLL